MKIFVLNDTDFRLKALYINSTNGVKVIHNELGFVICTWDILSDGDALRFHGCVPFHNVKVRGCTGEISNKKKISNPFFSHCNLIDMVCRMNIHQGRF
jgi:hypothetical protein